MASEFSFQLETPGPQTKVQQRAIVATSKTIRSGANTVAALFVFAITLVIAFVACVVLQIMILEVSSRAGTFPLNGFFGLNLILVLALIFVAVKGKSFSLRFMSTSFPWIKSLVARKAPIGRAVNDAPVVLLIVRRHSARKAQPRAASV